MSASPPPPPQKRVRVTQACIPCGVKKVKCDGVYPACGSCQNKGVSCEYGVSKRSRPRASNPAQLPQTASPSSTPRIEQSARKFQTPALTYHEHPPLKPKPISAILPLPAETSTRLLQTYFNCLHPLWPILYKPLYASLDYGSPDMIPPALLAAMFAFSSCVDRTERYPTNAIIRKYPEPWQFLDEALELLQQGDSTQSGKCLLNALTPSITTCQVLTILSLQQHGLAEYSHAAMFCGLASAMAIELRLHRAPESKDPIQCEIHSRLWWNLYILEKMMSSEMGRPVLLRLEESDCPYPSVAEADEFELMSTQVQGKQGITSQLRNTSIKLRTLSGLISTIRVSTIIERLCREVYGISARKLIRENQVAGEAKRLELWYTLQEWERDMEGSPLRLDLSDSLTSVPACVTNYVVMWHATILLHRPFIARWSSSIGPMSPSPLEICLQAANHICLTLEKYFDRLLGLPCDMVFSVFTAASTLLYHSKNSTDSNEETKRCLRLCIHWLSSLGKSWKSAGARHQLLADMFDLPQELRRDPNSSTDTAPQGGDGSVANSSVPATRHTENGVSPEDWGFLHDFGDASHEFYELDVQLRGLLDGGFQPEHFNYLG